jgi:hypothetical protein
LRVSFFYPQFDLQDTIMTSVEHPRAKFEYQIQPTSHEFHHKLVSPEGKSVISQRAREMAGQRHVSPEAKMQMAAPD